MYNLKVFDMSVFDPFPEAATTSLTGVGGITQIRTSVGLRRAEHVRPGDLIVTRDNGLQPVRLVLRTDPAPLIAVSPDHAVLRFAIRALGPGAPCADATIAPDQRLLLPGFMLRPDIASGLMPARALAGTSDAIFADRTLDHQPLFSFAFDRHEVISAGGLWLASFRPAADRVGMLAQDHRERVLRRYPQLLDKRDPFPPCAYEELSADAYLPQPC